MRAFIICNKNLTLKAKYNESILRFIKEQPFKTGGGLFYHYVSVKFIEIHKKRFNP